MAAPVAGSSVHKKLVLGAAGCVTLLVVVAVIAMISVRQLGFETPPAPRYMTPRQAGAALDSLSRVDFSQWLEPAAAPVQLGCRARGSGRVSPVAAADSLTPPIGFGDTFPSGSAARRMWEGFAESVDIESDAAGATPADSLPPGRQLLAALRVRLDTRNRDEACVLLNAVVAKTHALESAPGLDRIVAGARLARDAGSMVSRDSELQALTGLTPARAAALFATLDARKRAVFDVRAMIDAAGAFPGNADSLAAWAQDGQTPLPVRRGYIEAIGYGWVLDPPEMTFNVNAARSAALDRLLRSAIPEDLRAAARDAQRVLQGNLAQRFQFAVTYRTRRDLQP